MHIPITRYGLRELLLGTFVCVVVAVLCAFIHIYIAVIPFAAWMFLISFFRDPNRSCEIESNELISPADGTVADIEEVEAPVFLEGKALRIGIFMSVFNVHVNRSPCDSTVMFTEHHAGKYHDARSEKSITENEHNFIGLRRDDGRQILVNQISGLVARRIVCAVDPDDHLEAGQRIGMIKFGSRVELYIPLDQSPEANVNIGDNVKGGNDILARHGGSTE